MRVAIMQPTWLPWIGYFDLIDQVDRFVFLDTVQYCPRSWHSRNRVKTASGETWISLPVSGSRRAGTTVRTAIANPEHQMRKSVETIRHAYKDAAGFEEEAPGLFELLREMRDGTGLAEVNIRFIRYAMQRLAIDTETLKSSDLPAFEGRVERLIDIYKHLGADTYVSAPGSAAYLKEDDLKRFENAGLSLAFHRYDHPFYRQCGKGFTGYLSVVDLLLNAGDAAGSILRTGRRDAIPVQDFYEQERNTSGDGKDTFNAA